MSELKKEKKDFRIDWSKIDINDPIIWGKYDYGKPDKPTDPMAGERLLQKIKEKEAEDERIKKAKEQADKEKEKLGFGDPLKNKKWLVYGLIAVAGYFAYKKFKK